MSTQLNQQQQQQQQQQKPNELIDNDIEPVSDDDEEDEEYCFCKSLRHSPEECRVCEKCKFSIHLRCSGNQEFLRAYFQQQPYPSRKFVLPKMRALVEFLSAELVHAPWMTEAG